MQNQVATETAHALPSFTLPDCRWDAQRRLARLFRDICYNDARPEGCIAGNEFLGKQAGIVPDHVRALLRQLKDHGLIEIEVHGPKRRIRPLAKLTEVMKRGWQALWLAILERDTFPSAIRRLAAVLLKKTAPNRPDLEKLGIDLEEPAPPPSAPKNSSGRLRQTLRLSPDKGNPQETTTSPPESKPELNLGSAAVSLLTQEVGIPQAGAQLLAEGIAADGGTLEQLKHAVRVASTSKLRSPAGFIRTAVRAAVRGAAYLLPSTKSSHASDLGERPQRVVKAPRPIPPDWLPNVPYEEARGYCNEAMRLLRLSGISHPTDEEVRDMARQIWQREHREGKCQPTRSSKSHKSESSGG